MLLFNRLVLIWNCHLRFARHFAFGVISASRVIHCGNLQSALSYDKLHEVNYYELREANDNYYESNHVCPANNCAICITLIGEPNRLNRP
jgi:hypothetical protein